MGCRWGEPPPPPTPPREATPTPGKATPLTTPLTTPPLQMEELKSENAVLRAQLQQRGLEGGPEGTPQ